MKVFCLVLAVLLFFSSCYSTPQVGGSYRIEGGRYQIRIAREYASNPEKLKYAVNSFVKGLGETSYDIVIERRGARNDLYVIVPGSQPVEELPEVRHFHRGKTTAAIVAPIAGASIAIEYVVTIALFVISMVYMGSMARTYSSNS